MKLFPKTILKILQKQIVSYFQSYHSKKINICVDKKRKEENKELHYTLPFFENVNKLLFSFQNKSLYHIFFL